MAEILWAPIEDVKFEKDPRSARVTGYFGDTWMAEFPGVGYSPAPYSMKVLVEGGVVYRPLTRYEMACHFPEHDAQTRARVRLDCQPPVGNLKRIKEARRGS